MKRAVWPLVVSVALVAAMFLFVFPTRTYLSQRATLARTEQKVSTLADRNRQLSSQVALLNTDAEIERLARQDYGLVRPGQEAYAILPAPAGGAQAPKPKPARPAAPRRDPAQAHRGMWQRLLAELTFWR